jgi:hypothetical protein
MRLLVEEILDTSGKKVARVDLASSDLKIAAGCDVWLQDPDDTGRRRRMICAGVRMLVVPSGAATIVDVVDAKNADLSAILGVYAVGDSEQAPVVDRPCACGNPSTEGYDHAIARCARKQSPQSSTVPVTPVPPTPSATPSVAPVFSTAPAQPVLIPVPLSIETPALFSAARPPTPVKSSVPASGVGGKPIVK